MQRRQLGNGIGRNPCRYISGVEKIIIPSRNHYKGRSDPGSYLRREMIKEFSAKYSFLALANLAEAGAVNQLVSMAP